MHPDTQNRRDDSIAMTGIARTMEEVRLPLTILSARAQLLHRRIQQGGIVDPRACLEGLVSIQRAAQELEFMFMEIDQLLRTSSELARTQQDTLAVRQDS
jgi:predicted RNA-binding protein with EMAP domain